MKFKNITLALCLVLCFAGLNGCKKDKNTTVSEYDATLSGIDADNNKIRDDIEPRMEQEMKSSVNEYEYMVLQQNARVFQADYKSFLSMNSQLFDIAFLDPPYGTGTLQEALPLVAKAMNDTGVIIAENPLNEEILPQYGDFVLDRQYRYGKIKVSTFRHKDFAQ